MDQEVEQKKMIRSLLWIVVVLLMLLVAYVLSPPLLVEFVGVEKYGDHYAGLYSPLIHLTKKYEWIRNWYGWYFDFFPADYWYVWYLDLDSYGQEGGFSSVPRY